jgi:hypothetical protein
VARLVHPQSGEWARTMAFHYPPEEWTPGEVVLDYLVLTPPVGLPPVAGYQIGVGFYDPSRDEALPRLVEERFAGFEALYPAGADTGAASEGLQFLPMLDPPSADQVRAACSGVPRTLPISFTGLTLLGWAVEQQTVTAPGSALLPGSELEVRLCWQAIEAAPPFDAVRLVASWATGNVVLYEGPPASGYAFSDWRAGELFDDRYRIRLPRSLPAGDYELSLQLDEAESMTLRTLVVDPVTRTFVPTLDQTLPVHITGGVFRNPKGLPLDFADASGAQVRLLGYDLSAWDPGQPWRVTLAWQALAGMSQDYVVFLHLRETESALLVAQVDEMPREGSYPTSLWMRGEVVSDVHTLVLPPGLPPGSYTLSVGLYLPTGVHLQVEGATRVSLVEVAHAP